MEFRYTKEEEEFRQEVRQFLQGESELIEKVKQEEISGAGWGPYTREFLRKIGARGYLTPSWPSNVSIFLCIWFNPSKLIRPLAITGWLVTTMAK